MRRRATSSSTPIEFAIDSPDSPLDSNPRDAASLEACFWRFAAAVDSGRTRTKTASQRERGSLFSSPNAGWAASAGPLPERVGKELGGGVSPMIELGFFVELTGRVRRGLLVKKQSLGKGTWFNPERHQLVLSV
jgi:hypothetical protein